VSPRKRDQAQGDGEWVVGWYSDDGARGHSAPLTEEEARNIQRGFRAEDKRNHAIAQRRISRDGRER
jgi:hypothetical protein